MTIHADYEKLHINDETIIEVNWVTSVTPCKAFRISIGEKSTVVSRDEMFGLLFLFADDKQQEDLIPTVSTKVRSLTRLLSFKLNRDMKKGEVVRAPYQYFVPEATYERLLISDPQRYSSGNLSTNKLQTDVNKIV